MEKVKELYQRHRQIILYVFFGGCTTVVDFVVYWLCYDVCNIENVVSTAISLIAAILFAFLTNRIWVFQSRTKGMRAFLLQMAEFYGCRLFSSLFTLIAMWWTVDMMHWNGLLMKLLVNVVVIIWNYIASKFMIFRNRTGKAEQD